MNNTNYSLTFLVLSVAFISFLLLYTQHCMQEQFNLINVVAHLAIAHYVDYKLVDKTIHDSVPDDVDTQPEAVCTRCVILSASHDGGR